MAQRGVNKVILIGNVGNDPEIRNNKQGDPIANLSIATSETWKDKNTGQQQEKTEWHNIVVFGKLAEIVQSYVKKGSKIYVEGKLKTRKWQDKSGNDRYSTEIVLESFDGVLQMLDGKPDSARSAEPEQQATTQETKAPAPQADDFDDDIPF